MVNGENGAGYGQMGYMNGYFFCLFDSVVPEGKAVLALRGYVMPVTVLRQNAVGAFCFLRY